MAKLYVGIDLGGTNLKLGLVSADGRMIGRLSSPTEAVRGPDHVLDRMAEAVRDVAKLAGVPLADIAAVGCACPGILDTKAGEVIFSPNLSRWKHIHVRETMQKALGRPIVLENDANAAAYGEYRCGAGQTVKDLVVLTLGTGIGGGVILGGRLFRGSSDTGAELGHIVILHGGRQCGCGQRGCLEAYTSATAVVARFADALATGEASCLAGEEDFSSKDIFEAGAAGDALARRIVDETADFLATGITNLLHTLNPQMVVLTGGMMAAGDGWLEQIRQRVRETAFERAWQACEIRWSSLGGDAGILGAALAAEAFERTGQPA
jgi:glucokinase